MTCDNKPVTTNTTNLYVIGFNLLLLLAEELHLKALHSMDYCENSLTYFPLFQIPSFVFYNELLSCLEGIQFAINVYMDILLLLWNHQS